MTYIEFFDKTAVENICACLMEAPETVIFIGSNIKQMERHIERYKRIFTGRGQEIRFIPERVGHNNLDSAIELLTRIVETYDDCVFDITGGTEVLNMALGIVYERNRDRNIQIHRINVSSDAVYDCDKDGVTISMDTPMLSVAENIRLYGGDILYGGVNEENTYLWDLNPGFLQDVDRIWDVCKGAVRNWNKQIGVLAAAEKAGTVSEDGLSTVISRDALQKQLTEDRLSYKYCKSIITDLCKKGLLKDFFVDDSMLAVTYKNPQVKRCLTKAGQALEMKIYVTATAVLDEDAIPVYHDTLNGVMIDWDGQFHDEKKEEIYDTENEVDVMLMHHIVPVFISCKNGDFDADELYKLNTVAERFGGNYAKKVLVTTCLDSMGSKGHYLEQRMKDMNIIPLKGVQKMEAPELERYIKSLWNRQG